ncbi:cache domain-containing protein [Ornithinibacillus scapharcae]|uniref:cache domain-containing protein n=1 Tax=Ornithinibacillus scapharcae TaxID=1147159 RepID=UPI000225AAF8|nr:cache domain-containing protein [Ornithinibacillus scapharcae]
MIDKQQDSKTKRFRLSTLFTGSLQNKILFPFLILIIFTGGIIALVSYSSSVKTTTLELTRNVESQMVSMNDTFEMFFDNIDNTIERLISSDYLMNYHIDNNNELLQSLRETQETMPSISSIYIGLEGTGEVVIHPHAELGADFNVTERSWYQDAVEAEGDIIWSEPYVDASTGKTVVTAAKAYYSNTELVGVIGTDIYVNTLIEMINRITIGETGYAVILDETGKYMAHPNQELIGQNQSQEKYYKEIIEYGDQGIVEYQIDNKESIIGF